MINRKYSEFVNDEMKGWLEKLVDNNSSPEQYGKAMFNIGMGLGQVISKQINGENSKLYLACTVEDADFLAKGMLSIIEEKFKKVSFACFWNERFSPFGIKDLPLAPVIKKYEEPTSEPINYLIVVKSIISTSCVIRTNLTNLINKSIPQNIFVVSPVMYYRAKAGLKREFDKSINDKFQFFYFAQDNERTEDGEVVPGIGGMIYNRLGFKAEDKNYHIPEIVKTRRSKFNNEAA